jgi:hypothetical protein
MAGEELLVPGGREVGPPSEQVRLVVGDDLQRSRLTVFFRFFLAIPHLIVLTLWSMLALFLAFINWFAILFTGRPVEGMHNLQAKYLRYFTHVDAYLNLAANPFPGFDGEPGYPIDLEVPAARPQNRWKTGFRWVLSFPAAMLGAAFGASGVQAGGGNGRVSLGLIATAAFLGWFASLVRSRMPQGLRDLIAYGLGYSAQVAAYLLLVTDRYPDSDPLAPRYGQPAPEHPIRISTSDDLRRSRLTVFFRFFLWLPHLVWLILWGIVAAFAIVANWFVTLFAGRPADALHRFLAAYLRYTTHTTAFVALVANPFPGFAGQAGSYPVDLEVAPRARQNRWKTGFRVILAIPAVLISSALGNVFLLVAVFGWFVGLILGRMPRGLRNLGVFALRYQAQYNAYLWLLTDSYPFSGPSQELPAAEFVPPPPPPGPPAQTLSRPEAVPPPEPA